MAKPGPRTRYELVENELLARAADLFAERGYNGTSLQDIADTMGMTRPAIYHYFENKDALLVALVAGVTEGREEVLRSIRHDPALTPEAKLREAIYRMALQTAEYGARFRLLILSANDLPKRVAKANERARSEVTEHLTAIIAEGVAAGDLHDVDPRVAALVMLGMCNSIAWWVNPQGAIAPPALAELVTDLSLRSVKRPRRAAAERNGPKRPRNAARRG